jgi:sarcosine oxidase subunit beta
METVVRDVVIIGGGLIGCTAALELAERGASVIVVERGYVGAQASGTNFGLHRRQNRAFPQLPLSNRAVELWRDLERRVGDTFEFNPCGHFRFALDDADMDMIEKYADGAKPYGFNIELVSKADVRRRWPWLSDKVIGGGYAAEDGCSNPRLVTPAVARKVRALGATVIQNCEATRCLRTDTGFTIETEGGPRIEARFLINAAGGWAHRIAEQFGERVPLGVMAPPEIVTEPVPFFMTPIVQRAVSTVVIRQIDRGNVIIGGQPRGFADNVADRAYVAPNSTLANLRKAMEVVPALRTVHLIRVWSGIESVLPDSIPIIGPSTTTPGLFHAFGFSGNGYQVGPAVGEVLAQLVLDGETPIPIDAFTIKRFLTGPPIPDTSSLPH